MAVISLRSRRRIWEIGLAAFIICFVWLIQLSVLSVLALKSVIASFPLTFTIVWGSVFGSPLEAPGPSELRTSTLSQVIARQALSGSVSGAIVGAFFAALYASVLPIYPICYPLIGWIAGYFSVKNLNVATFVCILLVLLLTVFAEAVMAVQLTLVGRPDVLQNLAQVALPEAVLNMFIAPFIFFPMHGWYQFVTSHEAAKSS